MIKTPRLSLKGIKSFRGHEGHGLNATLLMDGVKVADVLDEGNGGSMRFYWTDGHHDTPNEAKVFAYLKEMGVEGREPLDGVVAELADEAENAKRLRRLAKTHVLFRLPGDKPDVICKVKHGGEVGRIRAYVLTQHPDATFIEA